MWLITFLTIFLPSQKRMIANFLFYIQYNPNNALKNSSQKSYTFGITFYIRAYYFKQFINALDFGTFFNPILTNLTVAIFLYEFWVNAQKNWNGKGKMCIHSKNVH